MDTKFDEYLEFPCDFTYKVVAEARDNLADEVVAVVQQHVPADYAPTTRPSSKGTYHSVSIRVRVESKEQIEALYNRLASIDGVRRVL
ncbi:hypothetical protein CWE15_01400 [Aliidiomarina taiwanensis]|uniref:UPF0250 protein CWE15_01400 n=1 Tax=Aliidiomarina taiwanensis TaxID=946228 RepID=A0A432X912_9GAMM|nr:DUF493 family protein YbeD [Aliidiomarina taiwanensis]RUO43877.1 hypothetical protein CWE15_01400 [Aliidiomarina taiwanensis]